MYLLEGMPAPDHATIARFISLHFSACAKVLLAQMSDLLYLLGEISGKTIFIDGTKIESAANKYTFVWKRAITKNQARLYTKLTSFVAECEELYGIRTVYHDQISIHTLKRLKKQLCRVKVQEGIVFVHGIGRRKTQLQKSLEQLDQYLEKLKEYTKKLYTLGDRNSYSKTDHDATFMRMKEDHMKNGQLKPAYNIQLATENQFITNLGIYRRAGDTGTLIPFLKDFRETYHRQSFIVVADAGYGSEQNYEFMENAGIEAFVKYNYFHKEQKRAWKKDAFAIQNLYYNRERDYYVCPMGQHMEYKGQKKSKSDLGYVSILKRYQAQNCEGCPLKSQCHKSKANRIIEVNYNLNRYKQKAREKLMSEEGIYHRGRRCIEPEAVFAQIKHNSAWNRFRLRGLEKVKTEFTLVAIAHNLRKLAKKVSFLLFFTYFCRMTSRKVIIEKTKDILNIKMDNKRAA